MQINICKCIGFKIESILFLILYFPMAHVILGWHLKENERKQRETEREREKERGKKQRKKENERKINDC